jgi:hypothetical protein
MRRRGRYGRSLACLSAVALLLTACGAGDSCVTSPVPASCPDLVLHGRPYVAWHKVPRPAALQEVGDATYPACNLADQCGGDPYEGHQSTDVWKIDGVRPSRAVLGYLENTSDTYVVYVRRGVDPSSLPRP